MITATELLSTHPRGLEAEVTRAFREFGTVFVCHFSLELSASSAQSSSRSVAITENMPCAFCQFIEIWRRKGASCKC